MIEQDLVMALAFVTEGSAAKAPKASSREVFSTQAFQKATARLEEKARSWVMGEGVQGLGLGEKFSDGAATGELALRVYVDQKRPLASLKNPVPKRVTLPELGLAHTDVLEIGRVGKESFTTRVRPAMPGCSVGHPDVSYGTFGCLVRRRGEEDRLYILSNSHVLADEGIAQIGDDTLQQGAEVGGSVPADVIGTLEDFVPFSFTPSGFPNLMDAAITKVKRKNSVKDEIRILQFAPKGVGRVIKRGMPVKKVGATSDFTVGVVTDINFRFALDYKLPGHRSAFYSRPGHGDSGRVGFTDQVLCTRYTSEGDSGSVVLNKYDRVIGLHFAGSPSASVFSPIRPVFRQLGLRLA